MAARLCPHCGVHSTFKASGAPGIGNWRDKSESVNIQASFLRCDNCGGLIVLIYRSGIDTVVEWFTYPTAIPSVDDAVPDKVASDFISAVNCMSIGENKAAATMFRRALQQIMIDKNASGDKLYLQIDDLEAKNLITSDLKDWAHEIRHWGNEGAHPAKDGLNDISQEEVESIRSFLESLFEYLYVMPTRVKASRRGRDARKQSP